MKPLHQFTHTKPTGACRVRVARVRGRWFGNLPVPQSLEGAEVFVPVTVRNIRIFGFPLGEREEVLLGNLPFLRAVPQVSPLRSWQAVPLDSWHASASEDQSPELVDQPVLVCGIVVGEICLELLKEFAFAALLAFQSDLHQGGDRLAHAGLGRLSVPFDLAGDAL